MLLSMLPAELLDVAAAAASSEDPTAQAWLPNLLVWFHRTFSLGRHVQPHQQAAAAAGASSSRRHRQDWRDGMAGLGLSGASVKQQLHACIEARSGSATQLATLLVALLRGVGFLTRSVW
jgi:hypothetical protein